jgi:uncharacterized OsmC-like protein
MAAPSHHGVRILAGLDHVRTVFRRNRQALSLRPALGRGTAVTRVRATGGLGVEITEGDWTVVSDATLNGGGANAAPNPGVLGRGALGACLAQAIVMQAADLGVPVEGVEVLVEADYDGNGLYGTTDVHAGYPGLRLLVTVTSPATEDDVKAVYRRALDHCPYLENVRRPIPVEPTLRVNAAPGGVR